MADRTADVALQVRDIFDAKAAAWPSKYAQDGRLAGRLTRLGDAVAYHVPAGGRVLDLGCGISPETLRRAEAGKLPSRAVDWVQLDPDRQVLPFGSEAFDAVVASSVLESVNQPAALPRECRRILRPGGIVQCTVPDLRHPVRWLEWLTGIVAKEPVVRTASRPWPQLDGYLTYLGVSRHRHRPRWWRLTAARVGLQEARHLANQSGRSPLCLLTLERPADSASNA